MYLQHSTDTALVITLSHSPVGAVTYTIRDGAGSSLLSGSGSTGPTTALSDSVSEGATALSVTDGSSFEVGDEIEIHSSDGASEIAIVSSVSSSSLGVRYSVSRDYAAGTSVVSRRCTVSVGASDITEAHSGARLELSYTDIDGTERVESQPLAITRYDPSCPVTEQDLLRRLPVARNLVDSEQPLDELIASVWTNDVLGEISISLPVTALVSSQSLSSALIYAVAFDLYRNAGRFEEADSYRESYERAIERIVTTVQKDSDSDGSTDDEMTIARRVSRVRWG